MLLPQTHSARPAARRRSPPAASPRDIPASPASPAAAACRPPQSRGGRVGRRTTLRAAAAANGRQAVVAGPSARRVTAFERTRRRRRRRRCIDLGRAGRRRRRRCVDLGRAGRRRRRRRVRAAGVRAPGLPGTARLPAGALLRGAGRADGVLRERAAGHGAVRVRAAAAGRLTARATACLPLCCKWCCRALRHHGQRRSLIFIHAECRAPTAVPPAHTPERRRVRSKLRRVMVLFLSGDGAAAARSRLRTKAPALPPGSRPETSTCTAREHLGARRAAARPRGRTRARGPRTGRPVAGGRYCRSRFAAPARV